MRVRREQERKEGREKIPKKDKKKEGKKRRSDKSLLLREKEINRVLIKKQSLYLLMHNNICLSSVQAYLSLGMKQLLKKYDDVFPKDIPHGLPHKRGTEYNIDHIQAASLPNRLTYRSNTEETKEIQKHVAQLMDKGSVQESLSPCVILVILVPMKDRLGSMCNTCRAIKYIIISCVFDPGGPFIKTDVDTFSDILNLIFIKERVLFVLGLGLWFLSKINIFVANLHLTYQFARLWHPPYLSYFAFFFDLFVSCLLRIQIQKR